MGTPRITRRYLLGITGMVGTAGVLAACGAQPAAAPAPEAPKAAAEAPKPKAEAPKPEAKVQTINTWWPWSGAQYDGPQGMIAKIVAATERANPNLKINWEQVPFNDIVAKLPTVVAAGTAPDMVIIFNGSGTLYSMAHAGIIQSVEEAGPAAEVRNLQEWMVPGMWELQRFRGKVYGIAFWTQSYATVWHKPTVLAGGLDPEKGPQTLDDFASYATRLTKREGEKYTRLGYWDVWFGCCPHLAMMNYIPKFGGQLTDEAGTKITADHPKNLETLRAIQSLLKPYDYAKAVEFYGTLKDAAVYNGNVAAWRDGPWRMRTLKLFNLDFKDYGAAPEPVPPGGQQGVFTYGDIAVIPNGAKNAQGGWRLARFLTGVDDPDTYAFMLITQPQIPVSQKFVQHAAYKKVQAEWPLFDLWNKGFFEAKGFLYPPKIPTAQPYLDTLAAQLRDAWQGKTTIEEALKNTTQIAQKQLDEALSKK
jgi:multiple sugar transport system substrate-binding protein